MKERLNHPFESRLDELCIDGVLRFADEVARVPEDPFAWKWALVSLHSALLCAATIIADKRERWGSVKPRTSNTPGRENLQDLDPRPSQDMDKATWFRDFARKLRLRSDVLSQVRVLGLLALYDVAVEGSSLASANPEQKKADPTRKQVANLGVLRDAVLHPHPLRYMVEPSEVIAIASTALKVIRVLAEGWEDFDLTTEVRGHTINTALDLANERLSKT